ncbi:hypothetical protein EIN_329390 [Entamoeba invadens IP1]|uniref:CXXC-rich protein n=1 Tax=Entamoeba invadens IP1 TaxID=370355 RepID=A0A0A1TXS0_ENTIV|nr:hypothetical protein EIN_329390 [Entamoeba invadens IP1]ELP86192.1 hypothetical protein EIN_329390 [Entamoeba invadens IP1]|eukprot:XP_004185538.1 hypothetical protein EIN_329390 [Entamoeba invadens IP1]
MDFLLTRLFAENVNHSSQIALYVMNQAVLNVKIGFIWKVLFVNYVIPNLIIAYLVTRQSVLCNATTCRSCLNAFYLDNGICSTCETIHPNCEVCDETDCYKCKNKLFLRDGKCLSCGDIYNNCTKCDETRCLECMDHFYLSNYNCDICKTNCDVCHSESTCSKCFDGYYYKEDDKICSLCNMKGYYIDSKSCKKCNANCIDCLSQTKCVSCIEGYYLVNTTSEEMTESFGRCTDCSTRGCTTCNSTSCITCEINKYIDEGGLCSVCKPDNDKCISCFIDENRNKKCDKCKLGFWIEDFECVTCETCGSSGCSNKTNGLCFNCLSPNEVLIEGICQIDENCISIEPKRVPVWLSDSNCVLCLEEYYLKDLKCLKCDEILTNCIKCGLLNYSNYNEVYCDICTIGNYQNVVNK